MIRMSITELSIAEVNCGLGLVRRKTPYHYHLSTTAEYQLLVSTEQAEDH